MRITSDKNEKTVFHRPTEAELAVLRPWRSKVLAALQGLGILAPEGDFTQVNKALANPKLSGKPLYKMDLNELKACYRRIQMWKTKETDARASVAKLLEGVWKRDDI